MHGTVSIFNAFQEETSWAPKTVQKHSHSQVLGDSTVDQLVHAQSHTLSFLSQVLLGLEDSIPDQQVQYHPLAVHYQHLLIVHNDQQLLLSEEDHLVDW